MKIKELKAQLAEIGPEFDECEVVCQKDSEGNGYSPLADININAIYISENTWSGEVLFTEWSAYDAGMEDEEWEEIKKNKPRALILGPTN